MKNITETYNWLNEAFVHNTEEQTEDGVKDGTTFRKLMGELVVSEMQKDTSRKLTSTKGLTVGKVHRTPRKYKVRNLANSKWFNPDNEFDYEGYCIFFVDDKTNDEYCRNYSGEDYTTAEYAIADVFDKDLADELSDYLTYKGKLRKILDQEVFGFYKCKIDKDAIELSFFSQPFDFNFSDGSEMTVGIEVFDYCALDYTNFRKDEIYEDKIETLVVWVLNKEAFLGKYGVELESRLLEYLSKCKNGDYIVELYNKYKQAYLSGLDVLDESFVHQTDEVTEDDFKPTVTYPDLIMSSRDMTKQNFENYKNFNVGKCHKCGNYEGDCIYVWCQEKDDTIFKFTRTSGLDGDFRWLGLDQEFNRVFCEAIIKKFGEMDEILSLKVLPFFGERYFRFTDTNGRVDTTHEISFFSEPVKIQIGQKTYTAYFQIYDYYNLGSRPRNFPGFIEYIEKFSDTFGIEVGNIE